MDNYRKAKKDDPVLFGVVGAGDSFIRYFYPELMKFEKSGKAELKYVTDIVPEQKFLLKIRNVEGDAAEPQGRKAAAALLKERIGSGEIKYFETASNILPHEFMQQNIDALYIATPNDTHREYSIQGMDRDLNILCEKPLASSVGDASEMTREAMKHSNLICMEASHYCYKPTVLRMKELISEYINECGPITHVDGRIVETLSYDAQVGPNGQKIYRERLAENILNWNRGGGITRDTGGHLIAILKMLGKPCLTLNDAKLYNFDESTFTADTALVADFSACGTYFERDARIHLRAAKFYDKKEKYYDIMLGNNDQDRGMLHIDFDGNKIEFFGKNGNTSDKFEESAHKKLLENFLEAVKTGKGEIVKTPFENAIEKIFTMNNIYTMSSYSNSGSIWRKNRLEFYAN